MDVCRNGGGGGNGGGNVFAVGKKCIYNFSRRSNCFNGLCIKVIPSLDCDQTGFLAFNVSRKFLVKTKLLAHFDAILLVSEDCWHLFLVLFIRWRRWSGLASKGKDRMNCLRCSNFAFDLFCWKKEVIWRSLKVLFRNNESKAVLSMKNGGFKETDCFEQEMKWKQISIIINRQSIIKDRLSQLLGQKRTSLR